MDLEWWFRAQDQAVARNRSEIEDEWRWLNAAVGLLSHVQQFVNNNPDVQSHRLRESEQDTSKHQASNVVVNLVNDAMGGIVNASRLLLFGCHSDAFALIRSAFESCSYAEYFAVNPQKVKAYLELEELISGLREAGFKVPDG